MTAPSPRLFEILNGRHPGKQPELEKETEWTYVYKIGSKSGYKLSKFLDESFEVSAALLRQGWPTMNEDERLEFGFNWSSKRTWSDNDTEILEIVIENGRRQPLDSLHVCFRVRRNEYTLTLDNTE